MKVIFTKHADKKFIDFEKTGLILLRKDVLLTAKNPDHLDEESDAPKIIASKKITERLVLRVVFKIEDDIMTIITFIRQREEDIMKIKQEEKHIQYPQFIYEKEDDVLNIWFSKQKIDYGEQSGDIITHFTEDGKAVYMEILDASRFLTRASEDLPKEIKQKFFSASA